MKIREFVGIRFKVEYNLSKVMTSRVQENLKDKDSYAFLV